jgi:hypothetical protein
MSSIASSRRQSVNMALDESQDPLRKAARRAADAGWTIQPPGVQLTNEVLILHLALDSNFWQALATAEQWPEWESHRQEFIDYLADSGDAGSFFAHLLK